ncbi:hypothetical protein EZS27_031089 [termite gut metagenome]|uniref:Uncharacterized protein n=1 Tax=termite gut metagenome TaxID=433724 RepID=A0A5J4QBR5_9ZZZZ
MKVNHNPNRHKEKVRKLLTSEEGLYHRSRRPIEPEGKQRQINNTIVLDILEKKK